MESQEDKNAAAIRDLTAFSYDLAKKVDQATRSMDRLTGNLERAVKKFKPKPVKNGLVVGGFTTLGTGVSSVSAEVIGGNKAVQDDASPWITAAWNGLTKGWLWLLIGTAVGLFVAFLSYRRATSKDIKSLNAAGLQIPLDDGGAGDGFAGDANTDAGPNYRRELAELLKKHGMLGLLEEIKTPMS